MQVAICVRIPCGGNTCCMVLMLLHKTLGDIQCLGPNAWRYTMHQTLVASF